MRGKPLGALGGLLIVVLVATALLAPVLAPYDPIKIKSTERLQAPSLNHLLGTDDFGRDILSRVIYGARISMLLGLGAVAISTLLAAIIGMLSGYYGGRIDTVLQRCIDTLMAFPGLVVLLTIMAMLGQGLGNVILALGIGGTAGNARIIRSAVLAIRENQYVEVARATGCRDWQIIARHILPNIAAPIMVVATLGARRGDPRRVRARASSGSACRRRRRRGAPCSAARAGPTCSRRRGWPCSRASPSAWPSSASTCWATRSAISSIRSSAAARAPRVTRGPYS